MSQPGFSHGRDYLVASISCKEGFIHSFWLETTLLCVFAPLTHFCHRAQREVPCSAIISVGAPLWNLTARTSGGRGGSNLASVEDLLPIS